MAVLERYHPSEALRDPEAYYADAFDLNVPDMRTVRWVGAVAKALSRPRFHFLGSASGGFVNADTYFKDIHPDTPIITTFSHAGKQRLHDISGGAAAVFEQPALKNRIPKSRTWAAATYLSGKQGEIMERLGIVPVLRSGDYAKLGIPDVPAEDKANIRDQLFGESVNFLNYRPGRTLNIFPAGTKGATELKSGVIRIASQVPGVLIVPVSMTSPREDAGKIRGNMPLGMEVVYGDIQEMQPGVSDELALQRLQKAQDDAYVIALAQIEVPRPA